MMSKYQSIHESPNDIQKYIEQKTKYNTKEMGADQSGSKCLLYIASGLIHKHHIGLGTLASLAANSRDRVPH